MTANSRRRYVPRPPRHAPAECEIKVERRVTGGHWRNIDVWLVDFSRQGLRLQSFESLEVGERLHVTLAAADGFSWNDKVSVRWRNDGPPGTPVVFGCEVDSPIDLETLGELLLRGILSAE